MWYNIEKAYIDMNVTSQFLFPQQIAFGDIENFKDIQEPLIEWMYHYKKHNHGIAKISNKGGWQSESKYVFEDKGFQMFQKPIVDAASEISNAFKINGTTTIIQMWLNINGPHSYNVCHRHPGSQLSGVLWVKQTPESGRFVFDNIDNRNVILTTCTDHNHLVKNHMMPELLPPYQDGTMLLFPSEMSHRVEINETDEDRLSISFNITISGSY